MKHPRTRAERRELSKRCSRRRNQAARFARRVAATFAGDKLRAAMALMLSGSA